MKRSIWLWILLLALPAWSYAQKQTKPSPRLPGYSPQRLARIAPVMNQLIEDGKFPGISVTVAKDAAIIYEERFGYADIGKKEPLKKDSIYRIYSMTKPITAVAAMILFEEGVLPARRCSFEIPPLF